MLSRFLVEVNRLKSYEVLLNHHMIGSLDNEIERKIKIQTILPFNIWNAFINRKESRNLIQNSFLSSIFYGLHKTSE